MELEESKANCFIDDMIAVLQDGKVLLHRQDAQQAVRKLQDLKKKDFIITTEDFEDILRQIKDEMAKVLKSTENAATKSEEEYEDLKNKLTELKAQMSEAEKKHLELKNKFTVLETEQKEEIKRLKVEGSPQQKQLEFEKAKSGMLQMYIEYEKA
ncbi:kinesin-like protein KIF20B isoform X2 [Ruditapes philippinarum]|uniref:kinesin-like protein KIF20B isoform X2 n=1 Tax=Ruditapes philippinarum TaxID=129788 RepID=UPI00295B7FBF|nr:kinesin-like protein KIF20B isoform X2 [Ruditapes philippinarum]